jgi:hypothetical protein
MHQRPRLRQKKPPPPRNSTSTTMIKMVSVDIHAKRRLGKDHTLLGVSPRGPPLLFPISSLNLGWQELDRAVAPTARLRTTHEPHAKQPDSYR